MDISLIHWCVRILAKETKHRVRSLAVVAGLSLTVAGTPIQALIINISPGATLAGNQAALGAFNRAAQQWSGILTDPITINIDADLASLNTGVIGSTSSVQANTRFNTIRNAMVADSATEADDVVVAALPTATQASFLMPPGFALDGKMTATKANLKALGFEGLDTLFGANDATITFSANFDFDFDNRDGVRTDLVDFETVAAHEIGHALGFVSVVDQIDLMARLGLTSSAIRPTPLDLFRFADGTVNDPITATDFTFNTRTLDPTENSNPAIFDFLTSEVLLSTGRFTGDGRQASHLKDNNLTGDLLGIMDPSLARGTMAGISALDLRVLDVIGYDFSTAPAPTTTGGIGIALSGSAANSVLANDAFSAVDPQAKLSSAPLPAPAILWLFAIGMLGLIGLSRQNIT